MRRAPACYEKDDKNGISVCLTDPEQQRRALSFINNLEYDNITVVGYSKGGNKAKYVSLLSDKVTRCVSFDGQGFSRQFQEKYGPLIEENRWKITNYALDGDFVNIPNRDDPKYNAYQSEQVLQRTTC